MRCDKLWKGARLCTMSGEGMGIVDQGVVASINGIIAYAGSTSDAPPFDAGESVECEGRWITPGLIDPHTHLIHGGDRAREFEMRLAGASYEEIAQAGGGIFSTMHATRATTEDELVAGALPRLDALMAEGATMVEVKSGYGLDIDTELKMLRAARRLGRERPISISTTFLGAHALPPEFADDPDGYITLLCEELLPMISARGLADAVDAFCEHLAFAPAQVTRLFKAASAFGLPVKLHAEQLSNLNGAALAAEYHALSADHLEYLDGKGVAAMAKAGTVATLLPGAFYFMRETKMPPIDALRRAGVPLALATDCNPGTSPLTSLLLVMNMAATLFRLKVEECLAGVTRNAARALGVGDRMGTLEAGKCCNLAIWDIERPADLVYRMGFNPLHSRVWNGRATRSGTV